MSARMRALLYPTAADAGSLSGLGALGYCALFSCVADAIEGKLATSKDGGYLQRVRNIRAKLTQFPKVNESDLGKEFAAIEKFLYDTLNEARTRKLPNPKRAYELEKQLYANHLRLMAIDAAILQKARELGETGAPIDPRVQSAISPGSALTQGTAGGGLTPANDPLPMDTQTNWWLWGGSAAGIALLSGLLWWKARKMRQPTPAVAVQGLGGHWRRKSRSR